MSNSSHVTSRSDASAGPLSSEQLPVIATNAADPPHDPTSHDDVIWSPSISSYRKDRVQLVPDSSSSSSSLSTTSRRPAKGKSKSKGVLSLVAEPYRKDSEIPSFRSARPMGPLRGVSSPAMVAGRPLSLSELISCGADDQNEDAHSHEHNGNHQQEEVRLHRNSDHTGDNAGGRTSSHPENLVSAARKVRNRSYSSPNSTDAKLPLSSFTDIWR